MMEIVIRENCPFNSLDIYFLEEKNGKRYLSKPIVFEFEEITEGTMFPEPTMRLKKAEANSFLQNMAIALNNAGFRDSTSESFAKEIGALKYHLEDMRKLVFKD